MNLKTDSIPIKNDDCGICFTKIKNNHIIAMINNLNEKGRYHQQCLEKWLSVSNNGILTQDVIESYSLFLNDTFIEVKNANIQGNHYEYYEYLDDDDNYNNDNDNDSNDDNNGDNNYNDNNDDNNEDNNYNNENNDNDNNNNNNENELLIQINDNLTDNNKKCFNCKCFVKCLLCSIFTTIGVFGSLLALKFLIYDKN